LPAPPQAATARRSAGSAPSALAATAPCGCCSAASLSTAGHPLLLCAEPSPSTPTPQLALKPLLPGMAASSAAYRSTAVAAAGLPSSARLVCQTAAAGRLLGALRTTLVLNTCGIAMGALLSPAAQNAVSPQPQGCAALPAGPSRVALQPDGAPVARIAAFCQPRAPAATASSWLLSPPLPKGRAARA
jgi:hypothetical protein